MRHQRRRDSLVPALLVAAVAACDPGAATTAPPAASVDYDPVTVDVSCQNGFEVDRLQVAADGALWGENDRGVYRSRDGAVTFERRYDPAPFALFEPDHATRPFPWNKVELVDGQTWILSTRNDVLPQIPNVVALTEDGGQTYAVGTSRADALTYDGQAGAQWPLDDGRILFQYLGNWYLTADGGATATFLKGRYQSAGTNVLYPFNPYQPDEGVQRVHFAPDVVSARPICPFGPALDAYLAACVVGDGSGCTNYLPDGCFGGPAPAAVSPTGAYAVAIGTRVMWFDGAWHFQALPQEKKIHAVLSLRFAGEDLWIAYREGTADEPLRQVTYRIRGALAGAPRLEKPTFRAGDGTFDALLDIAADGDDAWAVLAATPTRERAGHLVCKLGATAPVAPLLTGTPAVAEPGRLYLHARRGAASDMFDRLALTEDGRAYVAAWRQLLGRVPPGAPLWNVSDGFDAKATIAGITTNSGVQIYVNAFGERTDVPELHVLDVAPVIGLPYGGTTFRVAAAAPAQSQPAGWVSATSSVERELLLAGERGTWPLRAASWTPAGRRPIPGIARATAAGIALTKPQNGPVLVLASGGDDGGGWVTPIGLVSLLDGPLPTESPCATPPVASSTCVIYPGEATSLTMDSDGAIYVVDGPRGQVARKRPADDAFSPVATGLMHPADLALRHEGGVTRLYVLDGDVWVFTPSDAPAVRRAASAMTPYAVALRDPAEADPQVDPGSLPTASCVSGAPCLSPPIWSDTSFPWKDLDGWVVLADQNICLPGQDYGDAGTLLLNGVAVPTTSWGPASVCFDAKQAPHEPRRGALWLVRDDGVPSHVLPYAVVDPQSGATAQNAFDVEVPLPAAARAARLATSCRSAREEGCEVVVVGPLPTPLTATIDGLDAPVVSFGAGNLLVRWPDGLSPGRYTLAVAGLSAEVELVDVHKRTLGEVPVDQIGVPEHGQAVAAAWGRTFAVVREGRTSHVFGDPVPDAVVVALHDVDGGAVPPFPDDQHALQGDLPRVVAHGDDVVVSVRRASYRRDHSGNGGTVINDYGLVEPVTAGLFRLSESAAGLAWEDLGDVAIPDDAADGAIDGLASADGALWLALFDAADHRTHVLRDAGAGWEAVAEVAADRVRTVVGDGALYVVAREQVWRVRLAATGTVEGPFGLPVGPWVAAGAWGGGLALVTEPLGGAATLWSLGAGADAFASVAALPAVPGIGSRTTRVSDGREIPGVSAVVGRGAAAWIAIADRTAGETRGLRLATWDGAAWAVSGEAAGSFAEARCVGPALSELTAPDFCAVGGPMANGCTLFSCLHDTVGFVPRAATADRLDLFVAGDGGPVALFDALYGPPSVYGSGATQAARW
ncbi:MAG: hypothetical protein CVU56_01255 [Deltaproteobacteria bacterium HGW-Deltaproteobacteria-14]|jgi:hypothetical protein|nr:MAG: hypothetical protein CVU56_01255 [Deltaproteobacteria bacterium HGW-Deltaproteobacteria-14]